jgi:hypothetical protein
LQPTSTTVVAVVGQGARECVEWLGRAANVATAPIAPDAGPLERAVEAWREATLVHTPYFAHDADPLAAVADAWVARFEESGPVGQLEVAVAETIARWRAQSIELPDYYLVLDADSWTPTRRHWYLGVLHGAAPARVVPAAADQTAVVAAIAHLGAGRWWPPMDRLLDGVERIVPDRAGFDAAAPTLDVERPR